MSACLRGGVGQECGWAGRCPPRARRAQCTSSRAGRGACVGYTVPATLRGPPCSMSPGGWRSQHHSWPRKSRRRACHLQGEAGKHPSNTTTEYTGGDPKRTFLQRTRGHRHREGCSATDTGKDAPRRWSPGEANRTSQHPHPMGGPRPEPDHGPVQMWEDGPPRSAAGARGADLTRHSSQAPRAQPGLAQKETKAGSWAGTRP